MSKSECIHHSVHNSSCVCNSSVNYCLITCTITIIINDCLCYLLLQLLNEFNIMESGDMMETMNVNWNRVCEQLSGVSGSPSYADEKNTLTKIIKNVYHRKSVSAVVIEEVGTHIYMYNCAHMDCKHDGH